MSDDHLAPRDAYKAAFLFLDGYWRRGGKSSDEIAGLLGSMSLGPDGQPMDPAMWSDWETAVAEVRKSDESRFESGL